MPSLVSVHRILVLFALTAFFALTVPLGGSVAFAQRVLWPTNGHLYQVVIVPGGISWSGANVAAQAAGGHLATSTSAAENAFLYSLIDQPACWNQEPGGSDLGPWLGGYQPSDGGNPSTNWVWVTGESWAYTSWFSGEPNNFHGASENYLSFKCYGTTNCRSENWNDLPDDISVYGTPVLAYVIEWDGPANVQGAGIAPGVELAPNAPNPFVGSTRASFSLPVAGDARLSVVDVAGRMVRVLLEGHFASGTHAVAWDGLDAAGRAVAPGCYFLRLVTPRESRTIAMRLMH